MRGAFVAVVGPSGAGKDAVIEATRDALGTTGAIVFPRRTITRPEGAGERHVPRTEAAFEAEAARGAFALTWRAHGLAYGVPAEAREAVAAGAIAVANVSRTTLASLEAVFGRAYVVRVTLPATERLARIVARGREDDEAAALRVARPDPAPGHPVDLEIVNDGTLAEAASHLAGFLEGIRAQA